MLVISLVNHAFLGYLWKGIAWQFQALTPTHHGFMDYITSTPTCWNYSNNVKATAQNCSTTGSSPTSVGHFLAVDGRGWSRCHHLSTCEWLKQQTESKIQHPTWFVILSRHLAKQAPWNHRKVTHHWHAAHGSARWTHLLPRIGCARTRFPGPAAGFWSGPSNRPRASWEANCNEKLTISVIDARRHGRFVAALGSSSGK